MYGFKNCCVECGLFSRDITHSSTLGCYAFLQNVYFRYVEKWPLQNALLPSDRKLSMPLQYKGVWTAALPEKNCHQSTNANATETNWQRLRLSAHAFRRHSEDALLSSYPLTPSRQYSLNSGYTDFGSMQDTYLVTTVYRSDSFLVSVYGEHC